MAFPSSELSGKVSLVTGASRGIGAAIAIALAKAGSEVVINYRGEEMAAEEIASTIRNMGRKAAKSKFDVTEHAEVFQAVSRIASEMGRIDILVNNAGINRDRTLQKMSKEEWDQVLSVNLDGVFNTTKAIVPLMVERSWGRVINISSIIGILGNIGQCNYAASKAGILGFSKSIAKELAPKGITVNVVAPGFTATSMVESLPQRIKNDLLTRIPLKRFASPQEIGDFVAYLSSPKADYITGEVFQISGGMYF